MNRVPAILDSSAEVEWIGDHDGDDSSLDSGDSFDRKEEWSSSPPTSPPTPLVSSEDPTDETPVSEASPVELVPTKIVPAIFECIDSSQMKNLLQSSVVNPQYGGPEPPRDETRLTR